MSEFIKSVDDLIAREFGFDALRELRDSSACDIKDRKKAENIIRKLILFSIAHARAQIAGRKDGHDDV